MRICILVCAAVSNNILTSSPGANIAHLDSINRVHDRVLLLIYQSAMPISDVFKVLTAIPAKAPAAMFCISEKFGGRASYLMISSQ